MSSSSLQQETTQCAVADDGDLYFVESPFYWQNSNPSAIAKTWHGFLKTIGNENVNEIKEVPENQTEFESEIISTNSAIEAFRKFVSDGQKFGTISITNSDADSTMFEMLKRMYGSIVYVVFEKREIPSDDPRKKHERSVMFFSDYDLCALNERYYYTDDSYYYAITENRMQSATSSWQLHQQLSKTEYSCDRTRKKMYRNGFRLMLANAGEETYGKNSCPTKEEYFSNQKREQFDSQDLMNLLWRAICESHREDTDATDNSVLQYKIARELYCSNIIGFGWMPCLLAKKDLNELDKYILYLYDKCSFHNDMHKAEHSAANNEEKPHATLGTRKILVFENKTHDKFHPIERYPLDKVVKISREVFGQYRITDVNGTELLTDYINFVDDIPQVDIRMSTKVPGRYVVVGRYADCRCIKYEMDEREWKEHSYEIEKYIPGSLNAIKAYNLKQALNNGELSFSNSYSIPLKWKDTEKWDNIKVSDYYLSPKDIIYQQLPLPKYTYVSNGTYSDLLKRNN